MLRNDSGSTGVPGAPSDKSDRQGVRARGSKALTHLKGTIPFGGLAGAKVSGKPPARAPEPASENQKGLKLTSTGSALGTGSPLFLAGSNFQVATASVALFSKSAFGDRRTFMSLTFPLIRSRPKNISQLRRANRAVRVRSETSLTAGAPTRAFPHSCSTGRRTSC
jgi:hypothetical protein